ncbi:MAG: TetR/AcrR family transcriptional regulator [Arachnia sp.]
MSRRSRAEMLDATRTLLLAAGREFFGTQGYAATSMDDLTASVGLTRGALYHHFGGKSGLLGAVAEELDGELCSQLESAADQAADPLAAVTARCVAYIELTQAPIVQQILFHDAPSMLPDAVEASTAACLLSIAATLRAAQEDGVIAETASVSTLALLLNGALVDASRWVSAADEADWNSRLEEASAATLMLVQGLRTQ